MQSLHLTNALSWKYSTDSSDFKRSTSIRRRLLPPQSTFAASPHLDAAIEVLEIELPRELLPTLYWFEQNYVGAWNRFNSRRRPRFDPSIWSTYERTLEGIDRTNNFAEAANRRIRSEFGVDHPTLWRFIDCLRKVQAGRDKAYEQFVRGEAPPHKRSRYAKHGRISPGLPTISGWMSEMHTFIVSASTHPSGEFWSFSEDCRALNRIK
uniref:MADF domain-containing protein n=1 Tax=Trichuris muris TaxID=70415 RepID=A0A5S6QJM7_TRIMR